MISETAQRDDLPREGFPVRKGPRPKTLIGPMHIQCDGYGDARHLNQLVKDVLTWPHIESVLHLLIEISFECAWKKRSHEVTARCL
jgi:hypothetical protein